LIFLRPVKDEKFHFLLYFNALLLHVLKFKRQGYSVRYNPIAGL